MKKYKYGVLILHYCTWKQTKECVDSVLKICCNGLIKIVIVDNASNDKSGEILKRIYRDDERVDILILAASEGFSFGNNFGYRYIKQNYIFQYLLVLNNDIILEQKDFFNKIDENYKDTGFDVLGPDIWVPAKKIHQNPQKIVPMILEEAEYERDRLIKAKKNVYTVKGRVQYAKKTFLGKMQKYEKLRKIWHFIKYKENSQNVNKYLEPMENIQLHGSALIFSSNILQEWNEIFYPETKFYYEEYILFERIRRENKKTVYSNDIQVIHLHEFATKCRNKVAKQDGKYTSIVRLLESIEIYIDFLKKSDRY